jgi:uncharacterized membrane protein
MISRSNTTFWFILCVILILGAVVRVYGLTHQSLWLDEANSVRIAEKGFRKIISELKNDTSPPLHYFMLHLWIRIFGPGELSIRTFVCLFGILLIPTIYYVGASLFSRRMGLISAFIASVAQFHVRYSQEVRMYSMLALLGLLSMYFLYRAVTSDTRASWVGYTLCTALTIYTHNYGIFIATSGVMFFVVYAITHHTKWRKFLIAQCIIAIMYLPWLPILVMSQYGSEAIVGWIPRMRLYHIYKTFKIYSGLSFSVVNPIINHLIIGAGLAVFTCCFLAGMFPIGKHGKRFVTYIQHNTELMLLLCYLFVTLAIPMLISIKKPIYLHYRYSIAAWPPFALILGLGVSKIRNLYGLLIVLLFILYVSSISLYWHHFVWIKSHDRAIAGFIESKASEDDLIVFVPCYIGIPIDYYLRMPLKRLGYPCRSEKEPLKDTLQEEFPRRPNTIVDLARSKLGGTPGKVFLVHQESATWVANMQIVKQSFDESFTKIESKKYGNIKVTIYD